MPITGTDGETVADALASGEPLPGTGGFAGEFDGQLVRDVLGRYPLFFEREDPSAWSHNPNDLTAPERLAAGCLHDGDESIRQWTLPSLDPISDRARAVETLRTAIRDAIESVERDQLAVAFSGGIDSAVLAAELDVPLYTVGFPDSHDITAARSVAARLGAQTRVVELDHGMLERAIPNVVSAIGRTNAMDIQIAVPLYVLAEHVSADGFDRLALGQGADELFGGYTKVARAPDDPRVEADTIRGARREMIETIPTQLERDWLTIQSTGVTPVTPFLQDCVVRAALSLPGELLVSDAGERKWALRLAARAWLPDKVVFREKKALQYGSLVARELDRLARQAGFKRRMDDHVTQYIESLKNCS